MKQFYCICFVVMFFVFTQNVQANDTPVDSPSGVLVYDDEDTSSQPEKPVTIQQMKENLEWLKDQKETIDGKWETLNSINGKVIDYLKKDLTNAEITQIESLSIAFKRKSDFYESQLRSNATENYNVSDDNDTQKVKENFIAFKLDFYKQLVPFIDLQKKESYLEYIKGNIEIEKENKDIKEKIYKQEEVIEERVDDLKEKIKQHKQSLERKLEFVIKKRISEKLDSILNSEKIQKLANEKKVELLDKVIDRLLGNKSKLQVEATDSELIRKKIEIYDIAIGLIQERITLLK